MAAPAPGTIRQPPRRAPWIVAAVVLAALALVAWVAAGPWLAIRGIERGSASLATSNVYLDGIPLGTRLLESAALPPLQRVLYLRGPRSLWAPLLLGPLRELVIATRPMVSYRSARAANASSTSRSRLAKW